MNKTNIIRIIGVLLLIALVYFESFIKSEKDLDIFIGASKLLLNNEVFYGVWINNILRYYYSPLFALIISPLSFLPQYLYNIIWTILNIFFLYRIYVTTIYFLPINLFSTRLRNLFYLSLFLCSIKYILHNLDLGQMTIFLVFASMESIRLITNGKQIYGASLLAFAINIKLLPLTLLVYLFYRGEFRASIMVVAFYIIYLFLPIPFIGFKYNTTLLAEWYNVIVSTSGNYIEEDVVGTCLTSFIPSLLMDIKSDILIKRNIFDLSIENMKIVLNIVRIFLILLSLLFIRSLPFKKCNSKITHYYSISYLLVITPLIAPHQGTYSLLYLFPTFSYLIYFMFQAYQNRGLKPYIFPIIIIVLSFLLTSLSDGIIGRQYYEITKHLHFMTIGALLLIIPLYICKPDILKTA